MNSHLLPLFISYVSSREKLIKYQVNSPCVIMSVILMTTLFYKALILQGEIWCWSILGLNSIKRSRPPFGGPNDSFPLLSPLLSGHQALLAVFQEYDEGKCSPKLKVTAYCGPVMLLLLRVCFKNIVMFLLKVMLICDKPLLSGQPLLSGHLPVPRGWPLDGGSNWISLFQLFLSLL